MNDIQLTIFIIIISIIITNIDISTDYKECYKKNANVYIILFFHTLLCIFSYIGCFYNNKTILKIYLLCYIILPIHWLTNNNRCVITEYVNKICGFDINRNSDRILQLKNGFIYSSILRIICFSIAVKKFIKC
jgi:hypothetical protein